MIKEKNTENTWKTFALYGSLSLNLGFMILGGYFLGRLLETQYQLKNMTFTGILTGLFLGLYQMFAIAYRAGKKK
ncbi:MAG TPA: hypothetical protein PLC07_05875 [Bacillota bacterium]|nr:hypothetical protein [Bacillota bacterium]HPT86923.1 hypothetical protein [Bacillota bacterium]